MSRDTWETVVIVAVGIVFMVVLLVWGDDQIGCSVRITSEPTGDNP